MAGSSRFWIGVLAGALGLVVLSAGAALAVIYSGAYNIAATEGHYSLVRWAFTNTFHNSIERGAAEIEAPASFPEEAVRAGAADYKAMCQHCHAAPGADREIWAEGMLPKPPHLTEAAADWKANQIFWLIKHGARMTGMPAFGPTHGDRTLWNIVAFVQQLPQMTPERYAALAGEAETGGRGGRGHTGHRHGAEGAEGGQAPAAGPAPDSGAAESEPPQAEPAPATAK